MCSVAQSCLTFRDPYGRNPPVSSACEISQARSGLPFPSPGDLPGPRIESESSAPPALQADSLLLS